MTFPKTRLMQNVSYVIAILNILILSIEVAHSTPVLTTVSITNKGDTDVHVAAIYAISSSVWETDGWWTVKPGVLNWVEIETGTHGSQVYYLSFLIKNNKGELGHPKNMKIMATARTQGGDAKRIDKKFCVLNDYEKMTRTSTRNDLADCPPGYMLAIFDLKVTVPVFGGNVNEFGISNVSIFVHPDKSDSVIQGGQLFRDSRYDDIRAAQKAGNYYEAFVIANRLANMGHVEAQAKLGVMYNKGTGVAQNKSEALKWFKKAAENGSALAQYNMGELSKGETAVEWYRKAAVQGHSGAQISLGLSYLSGVDLKKNYEEAYKWFNKAAKNGDKVGQFNLGYLYFSGQGVTQNLAESTKWYKKSARKGYDVAQLVLGDMYLMGGIVEQDYDEAAKWFELSAKQGNKDAKKELEAMRSEGHGLQREETACLRTLDSHLYGEAREQDLINACRCIGPKFRGKDNFLERYKDIFFSTKSGELHFNAWAVANLVGESNHGGFFKKLQMRTDSTKAEKLVNHVKQCIGALPLQGFWSNFGKGRTEYKGVPGQFVDVHDGKVGSLRKARLVSFKESFYDIFWHRQSDGKYEETDNPSMHWRPMREHDLDYADIKVMKCQYSADKEGTISNGYYYWYKEVPKIADKALKDPLLKSSPIHGIDAPLEKCPARRPDGNKIYQY